MCYFIIIHVMALPVVEFSGEGYKIRKVKKAKKIIGVMSSCQKLEIILENKVISKLMLSKNVNNKKNAPKSIFFDKKNEKDSDDFDIEN